MKALNKRITTPTIGKFRLPLYTLLLWVLCGFSVVFSLASPFWLQLLLWAAALLLFLTGFVIYLIRDRLVYIRIHLTALRDRHKRSLDLCQTR